MRIKCIKERTRPGKISAAAFILAALFLLRPGPARAQDAQPSPSPSPDDVTAQANQRKAVAEAAKAEADARKAAVEADKAESDAKFPKPSTTPLAGTTTAEGAVIESQMVSYHQMALVANQLVDQIKAGITPGIKTIAVYNQSDVNLLLSYKTASAQLKLIEQGYHNLLAERPQDCGPAQTLQPELQNRHLLMNRALRIGPTTPASIFGSLLGSFVDMTALLRTNVEIKGQTFDLDQTALVSELVRAARGPNGFPETRPVTFYYPEAFPPLLDSHTQSDILGELDRLNLLKSYTEKIIKGLEDNEKDLKKAESDVKALEARKDDLDDKLTAAREELARLERVYGRPGDGHAAGRRRVPRQVQVRMLELGDEIRHLEDGLTELENPAGTGKLDKARQKFAQLKADRDCLLSKLQPTLGDPDKLEDTLAKLKAQNEQFSNFLAALIKVDNVSGMNPLTSYIKAEMLKAALSEDGSYWLQLKVLKAGGNNRVKTNLLWDIFTGGSRLSHSGGAIVEYILFNKDGQAIKSDTFTTYSDYIKAGKIKRLPNP